MAKYEFSVGDSGAYVAVDHRNFLDARHKRFRNHATFIEDVEGKLEISEFDGLEEDVLKRGLFIGRRVFGSVFITERGGLAFDESQIASKLTEIDEGML